MIRVGEVITPLHAQPRFQVPPIAFVGEIAYRGDQGKAWPEQQRVERQYLTALEHHACHANYGGHSAQQRRGRCHYG